MIKNSLKRGMNSFMYSVGIMLTIQCLCMCFIDGDYTPLLPEFVSRFDNALEAFAVQIILIGLSSASLGAGSVVMEMERLSLLSQSLIYLILTSLVWILVGCYCWGLHKYPLTMLSVGCSYIISYTISWVIQYRICKKSVEEINQKINALQMEGV